MQEEKTSSTLPTYTTYLTCDLQATGCGQCHRAGLLCYGYLDPGQLLIRDQTRATEQKVLARQSPGNALPPVLQVGWLVRARNIFFSLYVFGLSRSYHVLAPLCAKATETGHLWSCVDAVSLALMSFQSGSPAILHMACKKYVDSIRKVSHAVQDPTLSLNDETLQSVLLLDLYEKMVNRNPQSLESWTSHIGGAMSLIKARGTRNISSPVACQLSFRLSVTLPISYGLARLEIPGELIGLLRDLDPYITGIKKDFTSITVDTFMLKSDIDRGRISSLEAAHRAQKIRSHLIAFEEAIPLSLGPQSVICPDPCILGTPWDIYPDHFTAQLWTALRFHRLAMDDIIQIQGSEDMFLSEDAFRDIGIVVGQICAAVPQFILPGFWPGNEIPFSPLQRLRCCVILAPLFIVAQLSRNPGIRSWAIQILENIAQNGNLRMAGEIALLLKESTPIDYWTVYAMSGSYALAA
ncbi:C6 transcription factor [Talaromyces pinophilus]|uniref:C6 transcription factor n=1 Tax=Talaromyces pinophilus TaxID=128442 RepID=A0A6V8HQF5_TALPI|nr:C6 transcription factor [Talaromyces pinophilus]